MIVNCPCFSACRNFRPGKSTLKPVATTHSAHGSAPVLKARRPCQHTERSGERGLPYLKIRAVASWPCGFGALAQPFRAQHSTALLRRCASRVEDRSGPHGFTHNLS
eukprot:COSAG06_NODE_36_length_30622_cov_18.404869_9_plen_107_part_00